MSNNKKKLSQQSYQKHIKRIVNLSRTYAMAGVAKEVGLSYMTVWRYVKRWEQWYPKVVFAAKPQKSEGEEVKAKNLLEYSDYEIDSSLLVKAWV